jgi:hypothetical protein
MAINGILITDETKYKTEIIEMPSNHENMDASSSLLSSAVAGSGSSQALDQHIQNLKKSYSTLASAASISAENLKSSYYDTITNLTIEDISMKMQGQLVECFAYSFLNSHGGSNHHHHHHHNIQHHVNSNRKAASSELKMSLNMFQNNVMNIKSSIQVDCKYIDREIREIFLFSLWNFKILYK